MRPDSPTPDEKPSKPGKTRTWWHPLLASLLRWQMSSHYEVHEEVPVGTKPLQIDLLLVHKTVGELPPRARAILAGVLEYLGEFTLIEFKSPSDTLRAGDLQTFLAYSMLYRGQNDPLLEPARLHLLVIAPRLTGPYREEMRLSGLTAAAERPGVWRLQGGMHDMWLLETEALADAEHPLLSTVSPQFLNGEAPLLNSLRGSGYNDLMVYMIQQISQFQLAGEEFAMTHLGAEKEMHDTMIEILKKLPLEDRLGILTVDERLKGLPAEERLKGLAAEERLKGLAAEERLKGLPAEEVLKHLPADQVERLRKLLQPPG